MRRARPYFMLFIVDRDGKFAGQWAPQFGDYDRSIVAQERLDSYRGLSWRIERFDRTPLQREIVARTAAINAN